MAETGRGARRWRKKSVIVEAYQFTLEMLETCAIDGGELPDGLTFGSASYHRDNRSISDYRVWCVTIHGQRTQVAVNDWLIKEPDGIHWYPCKPDIFAANYDEEPTA